MDTTNPAVEETAIVPKQPIFIGCNEKPLVDDIIERVRQYNLIHQQEVDIAIMSPEVFMASYQDWYKNQPENQEKVKEQEANQQQETEAQIARGKLITMSMLKTLRLDEQSFTIRQFRDAYNARARKQISLKLAQLHIEQMMSTGIIVCDNMTAKDHEKEFRKVENDTDEIDFLNDQIDIRLGQIRNLQAEVNTITQKVEVIKQIKASPATEEVDETTDEEADQQEASDHVNDRIPVDDEQKEIK